MRAKPALGIKGTISAMAPEVDGSLDSGKIASVIKSRTRSIQDCYEKEIKKSPKLAGKVAVRFTIGEDGKVSKVRIENNSMGEPAVAECILSRLPHWRFPKPAGGSVTVSYPFAFPPDRGTKVEGKIQKPQAYYFLPRSNLDLRLERDDRDPAWNVVVKIMSDKEARTRHILKLQAELDTAMKALNDKFTAPAAGSTNAPPAHPETAGSGSGGEERTAHRQEGDEWRKERALAREQAFEKERAALRSTYETHFKALETEQRRSRDHAIRQTEDFVKTNPSSSHLPEGLFWLSELYFEQSREEYIEVKEAFDRQLREYEEGTIRVEPIEPASRLEKVVGLYRRLISDSPKFKLIDAVYYLLGYALQEQGEYKEAKDAYARVVQLFPQSVFVVESWLRIGEYHFDQADPPDLDSAIEAYRQAMVDPTHSMYHKALYKLAWAYYRKDDLANSVKYFTDLIDFYEKKGKGGKEDKTGSMMRPEAIKYIAIAFADENWPGAGVEKAKAFFVARGKPKYEKEVIRELGEVMYNSAGSVIDGKSNYLNAIATYKHVIALDPYDPEAPLIQDKIVDAYARGERNPEAATDERTLLANTYGEGSVWWKKNENDPEAKQNAQALIERNLYTAALFDHQQASTMRQNNKLDEALKYYKAAALSYGDYIKRFPHSKNAYELSYYYADCLFFSFQYAAAAVQYEKVRDSTAGDKYRADAMISVAQAWEAEVKDQEKAGKLPPLKTVASKDRKEGEKITPKPIAELRKKTMAAAEILLKRMPDHEKAAKISFWLAFLYYQHDDFDEARKRLAAIIEKWPKDEAARDAANLMIETYLAYKDWEKVAEWSDRVQQMKLGDNKFNLEMGLMESGAIYNRALDMFNAKRYDEAAKEYVRLVAKNPAYAGADKALSNAALALQNQKKVGEAAAVYNRIFLEYPASSLADYALFKAASNMEEAGDLRNAVAGYLQLMVVFPKSEHRPAAIFNAAMALEQLGDYAAAISKFQRFERSYSEHGRVPDAAWKRIQVAEKMKDWQAVLGACAKFKEMIKKDPKLSGRTLDLLVKVATAHVELGQTALAVKTSDEALKHAESARGISEDDRQKARDAIELLELRIRRLNQEKNQ
ncbi:MAG: AgmX/PglI C-terminal domain-containing protein [Deltaproteobacteria bacterium]|nr:AgmX/PglI C-terminal domain-containing protein [Deltaproteobacteria bacterium]